MQPPIVAASLPLLLSSWKLVLLLLLTLFVSHGNCVKGKKEKEDVWMFHNVCVTEREREREREREKKRQNK